MHTEADWDLLTKYLAGECTAAEQQQVLAWRQADARNQRLFEHLERVWVQSPQDFSQAQPDSEALWQRVQAGMRRNSPFVGVHVNREVASEVAPTNRPQWPQWGLRIAASVLLTLGVGTGAYYWQQQPDLVTQQTQGQQQKELTLPDGTRVWLNEGSKLSYPTAFASERREVTLEGEAYFEVVHLQQHQPFVIKANGTETTVLGTSFNVAAAAKGVEVSVVTGRVKLAHSGQAGQEVMLTKGWTGAYDPGHPAGAARLDQQPEFSGLEDRGAHLPQCAGARGGRHSGPALPPRLALAGPGAGRLPLHGHI
jgi:ferric-dicitrate binding protein FerR (iron transport regulator)